MIPFNRLGWAFDRFGAAVYPGAVCAHLCEALHTFTENAAVLDLGAGTGTLGRFAHGCRSDLELVAADPAEGMLRYVPRHVKAVVARAEALPFESGSFDAVLVGEALHHFDAPHDALHEIARVLRPGGLLFIYEFNPSTFLGKGLFLAEKLLGEPAHFYPPQTLAVMLEAHGFDVRIHRYGWRYSLLALRTA